MNNNNFYIGQLDVRISLKENTRVTSATGEKTDTPTLFKTVWAKVEDVSGTEDTEGKIIALNVRKYTVRYDPDLVLKKITDMFIDHDNEIYNIHSTAFTGRKEYITLKCSKRE